MSTETDAAALRILRTMKLAPRDASGFEDWCVEFARRLLVWQRERAEPVAQGKAAKRVLEAAIDDYKGPCTITAWNLVNATRAYLAIYAAPPPAPEHNAQGMVVPREPTEEMIKAASEAIGYGASSWNIIVMYRAMLSAAPAPSQDERDGKRYLVAFAHYHVNKGDGSDTCKQCGLDLRDQIHFPKWINARIDAALRGKGGA